MTTDTLSPWRQAARAYQLHARDCRACVAAGLLVGNQARCEAGAALWQHYCAQPLPSMLQSAAEKKAGKSVADSVAARARKVDAWEYM